MLTTTQIENFLNGQTKITYNTIQGPRLEVVAKFVRYGSEGWWMAKIEGDAKWSKEWVSTAKAANWAKARDIREAA
jgi:hypothetical protein